MVQDAKPPLVPPKPITRDAILKALQDRQVPPECPVCENNSWELAQKEDEEIGIIVGPKATLKQTIRCFGLVCKNCGYVRIHSLAPLGLVSENDE